eukprot:11197615-Lingulodinium_polyedra.AAC.1
MLSGAAVDAIVDADLAANVGPMAIAARSRATVAAAAPANGRPTAASAETTAAAARRVGC